MIDDRLFDRCSPLSWADSLHLHVVLHEWLVFLQRFFFFFFFFFNPPKWCTYSAGMAGATWNCSRLGASSVYTIHHAPCHFMQSHIRKVYACLAVTCHLHFWQNDRDLLRATAVTRGWNGYRNKSQHRKSTLENKILPLLIKRCRDPFNNVQFKMIVAKNRHISNIPTFHLLWDCGFTRFRYVD